MALNQDSQGPFLTIDLNCIVANYRALQEKAGSAETAAVVKANAYGLGVGQVAPVLEKAGCKSFFVATLEEAVQMRSILPNADIHVLNGILPGWPEVMLEHKIRPVLNSLYQVNLWLGHVEDMEEGLFADLHIDTGMSRLGLSNEEAVTFLQTPAFSNTVKLDGDASRLALGGDSAGGNLAAVVAQSVGLFGRFVRRRGRRRPGYAGKNQCSITSMVHCRNRTGTSHVLGRCLDDKLVNLFTSV